MDARCVKCGLSIPKSDEDELCNHCYAHAEGDIEQFGCKYLGNNLWDCGYMDQGDNFEDQI